MCVHECGCTCSGNRKQAGGPYFKITNRKPNVPGRLEVTAHIHLSLRVLGGKSFFHVQAKAEIVSIFSSFRSYSLTTKSLTSKGWTNYSFFVSADTVWQFPLWLHGTRQLLCSGMTTITIHQLHGAAHIRVLLYQWTFKHLVPCWGKVHDTGILKSLLFSISVMYNKPGLLSFLVQKK